MARLTQTQAIQHKAAEIKDLATLAGTQCGLPAGLEATTILEHAFAMAVAEMVGPSKDPARILLATKKIGASVARHVPMYCHAMYGG